MIAIFVFTLLFVLRFFFAPHFNSFTEEQLASHPQTWWDRVRISFFHVIALLSNTGFQSSNCDYDLWGRLFLIPTVLLMVVGGCAGSTSGGIKMVRVIVLVKYIKKTINELIHSTSMYTVKISGLLYLFYRFTCNGYFILGDYLIPGLTRNLLEPVEQLLHSHGHQLMDGFAANPHVQRLLAEPATATGMAGCPAAVTAEHILLIVF